MSGIIFYDQRMNVEGLDSFSPSAGKPSQFVDALRKHSFFDGSQNVSSFDPITRADLELVHDPRYVAGVFDGRLNNGFENNDPRVPEACLWTTGSLVAAVRRAAEYPIRPSCSPSSGFHHAGYGWGGGFCTFNGLLVAAALFLRDNPGERIGIIDCDFHYGDGTQDILKRKPELARQVVHHTSGEHFKGDDKKAERDEFFAWLHLAVEDVNDRGCGVVIYQAGADMHADDPLGGLLDDADMRLRDRTVFHGVNCGIAWNLAGGYRTRRGDCSPVIDTHLATYGEAHAATGARRRRFSVHNGELG